MSETLVTAALGATFLVGIAVGLWLRGWWALTQDAIRRLLRDEQRGRRGCEERERKLVEDLRRLTKELSEKGEQLALVREVLAGNLMPDIMDRPDTA